MTWEKKKLGEIAQFRNGLNYTKDNFGKGLKVINVGDFQNYFKVKWNELDEINPTGLVREDCYLKNGDIVFVRSNGNRDLIGRSLFIENIREPVSHSAFTIKARFASTNHIFPKFYAYVFRSSLIRQTLSAQGNGTNISNLNQTILSNLVVPFPPLKVQKQIAAILSAYDELIENNERRILLLEETARRAYDEWFVSFRFPGHEETTTVESELGLIPTGWSVKKLYDVAELTYGFPYKSKFFNEVSGIPVVRIRDIKRNFSNTLTPENVDSRYLIANGDILVGMDGIFHMGKWSGGQAALNQRVVRFRPNNELPKYLLYCMVEKPIKYFESTIVGTTVAHLSAEDLKSIKVIWPSSEILGKAREVFDPLFNQEMNLSIRNALLTKTRDLLLPKLVSGEVDVSHFPEPETI